MVGSEAELANDRQLMLDQINGSNVCAWETFSHSLRALWPTNSHYSRLTQSRLCASCACECVYLICVSQFAIQSKQIQFGHANVCECASVRARDQLTDAFCDSYLPKRLQILRISTTSPKFQQSFLSAIFVMPFHSVSENIHSEGFD